MTKVEKLPSTEDLKIPTLEHLFKGYGLLKLTYFDVVVDETQGNLLLKIYRSGDTGGTPLATHQVSPLGVPLDGEYSDTYGCYLPGPEVSVFDFELGYKVHSAFAAAKIETVRDLITGWNRTKLLCQPSLGKKTVQKIEAFLAEHKWLPRTWMDGYDRMPRHPDYILPPPE